MAAAPEVDNSPLCPSSLRQLAEMPGARPAFSIDRTGAVTVSRHVKEPLLQFDLGAAGPGEPRPREGFVRVELLKKKGKPQTVCARVRSGAVYRLPSVLEASPEEQVVVRLYDVARGEAEQKRFTHIRNEREKALVTQELADRERAALRKQAKLEKVVEAAKALEHVPPPPNGAATLKQALQKAQGELMNLRSECPKANKRGEAAPLLRVLCDEVDSVQASLDGLEQKLANHENTPNDTENQLLRYNRLKELVSAAAALNTGARPTGKALEAHCEQVATVNWLRERASARLVAQAELPLVPADGIVHARYDAGGTHATLPPDELFAVLLHRVPTDVQLGTGTVIRKVPTQQPLAESIGSAITLIAPLLPRAADFFKAHVKVPGAASPALDPRYPTLLCKQPGKLTYKVDAGAAPIATVGTRVAYKGKLKDGEATELFICDKKPCETQEDNEHLRTRVTLEPEQESRFPILVELGATGAFSPGLSFGSPRYEPIGGPTGPQRIYELRSEYEADKAVSLSMLFGYRMHPKFALVGGPSVLVGASGGTFSQFNLRGAYALAEGAYFTFGPSMRLVQTATAEARLGSRITVENKDDAKVPEPLGLEYRPRFGFSIGVAVDVSVLSDAGKGLLKAVGVTQ